MHLEHVETEALGVPRQQVVDARASNCRERGRVLVDDVAQPGDELRDHFEWKGAPDVGAEVTLPLLDDDVRRVNQFDRQKRRREVRALTRRAVPAHERHEDPVEQPIAPERRQ